jgi:hypothetical protein
MNEALQQQISAFIDGELPENESELLLRRMSQDAELKQRAARFMAIGGAIRGDLAAPSMSRLRERIAVAMESEPASEMARPAAVATQNRLMRPIAGVAVAASVAVLALVGLRQLGFSDEVAAPGFDDRSAVAIDGGSMYTEPPVAEFISDRPSDMLTQYYLSHGQQSANLGSRLVGLEVREDRLGTSTGTSRPTNGAIGPDSLTPDDEATPQAEEIESAQ